MEILKDLAWAIIRFGGMCLILWLMVEIILYKKGGGNGE